VSPELRASGLRRLDGAIRKQENIVREILKIVGPVFRSIKRGEDKPNQRKGKMTEDMLAILAFVLDSGNMLQKTTTIQGDVYAKYGIAYKKDGGMGFLNALHSIQETGLIVDTGGSYHVPFNRLVEARELQNDFVRSRKK
jgi:hypothetical protein